MKRTRQPAGDVEYHFLYRNKPACLPVWNNGQLLVYSWAGYCPREQLEAGNWTNRNPHPVSIPVTFICDGGVWYPIKEMIIAVMVQRSVYIITQPADYYHKIMCGTSRMVIEE